jgi:hypothetical protein
MMLRMSSLRRHSGFSFEGWLIIARLGRRCAAAVAA